MKITTLLIIITLISGINSFPNCNSAYKIWIIPDKYSIDDGDSIKIRFGITGYGEIDIYKSKFCIYSEKETLILMEGTNEKKYEIFTSILTPVPGPKSHLYDIYDTTNIIQGIALKSDYLTSFKDIIAYPKTPGDKKLVLIFTYNCDGEWKSITKEFNYHVNSWSEKNDKLLNVFYLFGAILTFLAFTPNNYISQFFIWTYKQILRFWRWEIRKSKKE